MAVTEGELENGRRAFGVLGDPTRRLIFEQLSRRPNSASSLTRISGVDYEDIRYGMNCVKKADILNCLRHNYYRIDPYFANCARKYVDVLLVTMALSHSFT